MTERWWPLGRDKGVVVDPARNFGKPIIDKVNISIDMILDLYRSGHRVEAICDWYEIEQEYVELGRDQDQGDLLGGRIFCLSADQV